MVKTVTLLAKKSTLAKDKDGRKVRVAEGETFETDLNTANLYRKQYRNLFELVEDGITVESDWKPEANNDRILELEASEEKLIKENEELEKVNEKINAELTAYKLNELRAKYEWVETMDINMNDLRKIVKLKGLEVPANPSKKVLAKILDDANTETVEETETEDPKGDKVPETAEDVQV